LFLNGGLGIQSGFSYDAETQTYETTSPETNQYGPMVGELSLTGQYKNGYLELRHISGINTEEEDLGLNSVTAGVVFTPLQSTTLKFGAGFQPKAVTNDYGIFIYEASAMYEWEGLYAKATKISDMEYLSFGFIKRF
jgi:hypothetical protein